MTVFVQERPNLTTDGQIRPNQTKFHSNWPKGSGTTKTNNDQNWLNILTKWSNLFRNLSKPNSRIPAQLLKNVPLRFKKVFNLNLSGETGLFYSFPPSLPALYFSFHQLIFLNFQLQSSGRSHGLSVPSRKSRSEKGGVVFSKAS